MHAWFCIVRMDNTHLASYCLHGQNWEAIEACMHVYNVLRDISYIIRLLLDYGMHGLIFSSYGNVDI